MQPHAKQLVFIAAVFGLPLVAVAVAAWIVADYPDMLVGLALAAVVFAAVWGVAALAFHLFPDDKP